MMRARTGSRSFCAASLLALAWPLLVAAAEETPRAVELSGTVPATLSRAPAPAANEEMAKLLKPFDIPAAEFKWQMKPVPTSDVPVYNVTFPSPVVTAAACNNTVHCEYFAAQKSGRRPAVIVLHILNGNFVAERLVCGYLAADGTNALLLKMPYYGPRRPPEWKGQMSDDIEMLAAGMQQAVMDVRRAAAWLSSRPEVDPDAIGLCGISLGG
ncbi:MAG: dienelactone hydrolase family protein, partial [Planctomycetota bacterium]|nr:dienelactone hydrolase family protein [Planctomycetota bacterium]